MKCAYMHAFSDDDWTQCPPDAGSIREYKFKDGTTQWYCDDAASQVRDDHPDLELVQTPQEPKHG